MPLLVLSKEHKEHLAFLSGVDPQVVRQFAGIAMEFIKDGENPKVYQAAAKKLQVAPEAVMHGVRGLMFLLTECSKLTIAEMDFQDSIIILGFPDELNATLLELYNENQVEVREILGRLAMKLPSYEGMHWRLDAQVSSRSLKRQAEPTVVVELITGDANADKSSVMLQTDPTTLRHITRELEAAIKQVNTSHYRRTTRAIK